MPNNTWTKKILVTGAGGFIAHHLTTRLKEMGCWVRAADVKFPEYGGTRADEFLQVDLRDRQNCAAAVAGVDEVYHLAADMGGIGYISQSHAEITLNNTLIDVGMVEAAQKAGVSRFLYSSSACVYPQHLQHDADVVPLKEEDAFPAAPEEGYGLEKLYTEKLCQYFTEDFGMATRVVRFHNVGRNSDNAKLRSVLGWEPKIGLRTGLVPTYGWIAEQLALDDAASGATAHPRSAAAAPAF